MDRRGFMRLCRGFGSTCETMWEGGVGPLVEQAVGGGGADTWMVVLQVLEFLVALGYFLFVRYRRYRRRAVGGQATASTVPPRVLVTRPLDSFVGPDVPVLQAPPPSPSSSTTTGPENRNCINNENFSLTDHTDSNLDYLPMEVVVVEPIYSEIDDPQPPVPTTTL